MQWEQKNGFLHCKIENLEALVKYGCFRFLSANEKIANAVLYDKVSSSFKFGFVIVTRNTDQSDTYTFKCKAIPKYSKTRKNPNQFIQWCKYQNMT